MEFRQTRDTLSCIYLDSFRIRNEVFVKELGIPIEKEIDQNEAFCIYFVLYDPSPVATCRVFPDEENGKLVLQRMAVVKEQRKLGRGKDLISYILLWAEKRVEFSFLEAQVYFPAKKFYEKLDFTRISDNFYEDSVKFLLMKKDI